MKMFELLPRPLGAIFRKLTHLTCNSPGAPLLPNITRLQQNTSDHNGPRARELFANECAKARFARVSRGPHGSPQDFQPFNLSTL